MRPLPRNPDFTPEQIGGRQIGGVAPLSQSSSRPAPLRAAVREYFRARSPKGRGPEAARARARADLRDDHDGIRPFRSARPASVLEAGEGDDRRLVADGVPASG